MSQRISTISLFVFLSAFSFQCEGQKGNDKSELDKLLQQELLNQQHAKSGNKNPQVTIITDAAEVARITKDVQKAIEKRKKEKSNEAAKELTLAKRYKQHDKSVVPEILKVLKGAKAEDKRALYDDLEKDYDDPEDYIISEPEIINQIYTDLSNPVFEKDVVQLAGINMLAGYETKFEERLLSGKSTDPGRIFYWLSNEAKSEKALDYIISLVNSKTLNEDQLDEAIGGMKNFGENANEKNRKAIGEAAYFIYTNKLIAEDRIADLKNSGFTSDEAEDLLICLFEYGDSKVIPIANEILQRKIRTHGPVKALLRLEGAKHMDKVYALLRKPDDYYDGLNLAEDIDKKYVDDKLVREVLLQFQQIDDPPEYVFDRMVGSLKNMGAEKYLENPALVMTDKKLAGRLTAVYERSKITPDIALKDLLEWGILQQPPAENVIQKQKVEAKGDARSFIQGILDHEKKFIAFDTETGFVPADYDELIYKLAAISGGLLKDIQVSMDVKADKKWQHIQYTLTTVSKDKAFVTKPQDMGDWYDMMTVESLLAKLVENTGTTLRFISLDTGDQTAQYIFGDPKQIEKLVKKYNL